MTTDRGGCSAIEISVIIPTFCRPELLRAAVGSVLAQERVPIGMEIVVIDNDPTGSAEPIMAAIANSAAMEIRYLREPRPGISHARNAGVAASRGVYVAFLDDDETASPHWLASLLSTMRACEADIVVGPIRAHFPVGMAVSDYAQRVYNRDAKVPTGQAVAWFRIGNALLRRDRCLDASVPFDLRLGLSGGEDAIFLARLRERGRRIVWCAEAAATREATGRKR